LIRAGLAEVLLARTHNWIACADDEWYDQHLARRAGPARHPWRGRWV